MRTVLFLFTALLLPVLSFAQLTFQKTYGGSWADNNECMNRSTGTLTTVPGAGYALAHTTQSFGPPANPIRPSVYFLRLDLNGDTLCTRTYENGAGCFGRSIYTIADGAGFIIGADMSGTPKQLGLLRINQIGDTLWTRNFGLSNGSCTGYYGLPLYDGGFAALGRGYTSTYKMVGMIGKVSATGNMVFGKSYVPANTAHEMYFYSACESYDHGLLATGLYWPSSAAYCALLMKTDSAGNVLWTKTFTAAGMLGGYQVMELPDHSIMITGYVDNAGFGEWDAFVIKTDPNGNLLFAKKYGDAQSQWTNSMRLLPNGNVVLCGLQETQNVQSNALLMCIDQAGAMQWTQRYGAYGMDLANSLTLADDGGIAFTGFANSFGAGNTDIYFVKTDAFGQVNCYMNPLPFSADTLTVTTGNPAVNTLANLTFGATNCSMRGGATITPLCTTLDVPETGLPAFTVYPNPSADICTITGSWTEAATLTITNTLGQEVLRREDVLITPNQPYEINVSELNSGLYVITIGNGTTFSSQRLVIRHNTY
jgi:hypothetical protein